MVVLDGVFSQTSDGDTREAALVHGSELRTDCPAPERESLHSVTLGHPELGHRVEDPAASHEDPHGLS